MPTLRQAIRIAYSDNESAPFDPFYDELGDLLDKTFLGDYEVLQDLDPFDTEGHMEFATKNAMTLTSSAEWDFNKNSSPDGPGNWQTVTPEPHYHKVWASPDYVMIAYVDYMMGYWTSAHWLARKLPSTPTK